MTVAAEYRWIVSYQACSSLLGVKTQVVVSSSLSVSGSSEKQQVMHDTKVILTSAASLILVRYVSSVIPM